ncbi:MAG: 3-deoxy-7-phosphoheptulonate synthase [Bdellovibrionales bacterium]|nr:3-deoxy-7-phosphoheptulonate synthase [Bdellovibrionales bacterium]
MKNTVNIGPLSIGNSTFTVIAGPCSIESEEQFVSTSEFVMNNHASMVRGGMFKMRTQPDAFQGLGEQAISLVRTMKDKVKAPFIAEITDPRQIDTLMPLVDCFQVGSRNMYNYELLKELGQHKVPVLLKRGFSALINEWVKAADYIVKAGNEQVILCERGIRSFENTMRNTLDLASVAYLKTHFDFPVIVDPSHGTGRPELIPAMSKAAIACGADGIIVEVHPNPEEALSDGFQALTFDGFKSLMDNIQPYLKLANRSFNHG